MELETPAEEGEMFVLELAPKKGRPTSPYKVKSAQK